MIRTPVTVQVVEEDASCRDCSWQKQNGGRRAAFEHARRLGHYVVVADTRLTHINGDRR